MRSRSSSRSTPRSLSRRSFAISAIVSLGLPLAGCVSNGADEREDPSRPATTATRARDTSTQLSVHVDSPECAVSVGQSTTISVQARYIGTLAWKGASIPNQWNVSEVLGDGQFDPHVSGVRKSLPPEYVWNPPAETVTGTIDIHVPDTASPGKYIVTLVASNKGVQETGEAVIHITDTA
jgi:hypothetical protein